VRRRRRERRSSSNPTAASAAAGGMVGAMVASLLLAASRHCPISAHASAGQHDEPLRGAVKVRVVERRCEDVEAHDSEMRNRMGLDA
jgi:hypothetical protein